jgi:hypothetical protein
LRNFKLYGYANSTWYDLSSYVDRDITVPVWTRNKNGTPTAEGFQFGLVDTVSLSILQNLTRVKFSVDNNSRFLGTVVKKRPVVTKRIWEYDLLNAINEMDSYNVEHAAINSLLVNSSDPYKYKSADGGFNTVTYTNVSLPWLLECLLTKSNLPYSASALYNESAINLVASRNGTMYLRDIRFDLNMLYAVNQEVAAGYWTIDDEILLTTLGLEFASKKITGFKLFTMLCGAFGITCRFENDYYTLERREGQTSGERYIISQSDIYDDDGGNLIEANIEGTNFEMKGAGRFFYYADHPVITDLQTLGTKTTGNGHTVEWYRNLIPLLQDKTQAPGITQIMFEGEILNPRRDLVTSLYFKENGGWDETVSSIQAAIQDAFYNVDEHYINPRKERSIIKQGVYS